MVKKSAAKKKVEVTGVKFSIKGLHNEVDAILERLKSAPNTEAARELKRKMQAIQLMTYCGQDMSPEI
jgi:hypothetical protein